MKRHQNPIADGRNVGYMGESTVESWCAEVGIVANRVIRDRTGWDGFLEFSEDVSSKAHGGALDTLPDPIKCLIQIKSTDRQRTGIAVTLSNLHRMVTSTIPALILVLEFDGQTKPQRAFLLHVDPSRSALILKRIREISNKHHKEARRFLRKLSMTLAYAAPDALPTTDGAGLRTAMGAHIGTSLERYVAAKRAMLERIGYEHGATRISVSFLKPDDGRSPSEFLVDVALGIERELEVVEGSISDVRFGIPAPEPLEILRPGSKISMGPTSSLPGVLKLTNSRGALALVHMRVFGPQGGIASMVPEEHLKLRLESPFMGFLYTPFGSQAVTCSFRLPGYADLCSLKELREMADVVLLLAASASEAAIITRLEIAINGEEVTNSEFSCNTAPDDEAKRLANVVVWAASAASALKVEDDTIIQVGSLLPQEHNLRAVHGFLAENADDQKFEIGYADETPPPLGTEICAPMAIGVLLGAHYGVFAGAYFGVLAEHPNAVSGGPTHCLRRLRWRLWKRELFRADATLQYDRNELLAQVADAFAGEALVIRYWEEGDHSPLAAPTI